MLYIKLYFVNRKGLTNKEMRLGNKNSDGQRQRIMYKIIIITPKKCQRASLISQATDKLYLYEISIVFTHETTVIS